MSICTNTRLRCEFPVTIYRHALLNYTELEGVTKGGFNNRSLVISLKIITTALQNVGMQDRAI